MNRTRNMSYRGRGTVVGTVVVKDGLRRALLILNLDQEAIVTSV
jgi:hypothetical protein